MKFGNRMPVDVGVVLVAGLTMALSGCTPNAVTLAARSAPVAAAGPAQPVSVHSAPSAATLVADHSVPVGAYSAPFVHCVDIPMPGSAGTIGATSVPHCVVFSSERDAIADHSVPVAAPVADSSAPRCVEIVTPTSTMRHC